MKLIQSIALIIILWGLPTFILLIYGDSAGSNVSYMLFILLIGFYFLNKKRKPSWPFLILGFCYFIISGLVAVLDAKYFIFDLIKYFIIVICGAELARNTTQKMLFIILVIGASSIVFHAFYFQAGYGRYSGFFLNPNGAGLICIIGYSLGYSIDSKYLKLAGQFLFTFAGILTMSRTFIALWLLTSITAAIMNKKEMTTLGIGSFVLIIIFSLSSVLNLDAQRFSALEGLLDKKVDSETITEDSRTDTWSFYTDVIIDNVIFGNGYKSMQGEANDNVGISVGVHNTYLMILGESGFIPFLIFIFIYIKLFLKSIRDHLESHKEYMFMLLTLIIFLFTSHNYFDNYFVLFISLWIFVKVNDNVEKQTENIIEQNPLKPI